jgi:3',5'-cyclic AMP phosphodiesterase CpdA
MKQLSVIVISDPHYYSKKNWIDTDPFKFPPERDQQYRRGSEEILKFVFDEICKNGEPDIVLINGDLTNNGECTSHEEMRELLRSLKQRGKRVYVTTATHDYALDNSGFSYGFDKNNNAVEVPAFTRDMLFDYYYEFGMNEALSIHQPSMCYTVKLNDDFILLALNDDHGKQHAGYSDSCFKWIEKQVEQAKKNGQFIVAMTHHPMLPPSALYKLIAPTNVIEDGEETAKRLADMGIPCIFTGHSHVHNISSIQSNNGNILYDVSTASIIGYPPFYRHVTFNADKKEIDVSSTLLRKIPELDTDGLPLSEFTKKLFLGIIEDIFQSAENDYEKFTGLAVGFSLEKEKAYKLKPFISTAAKYFNHLTFGRVWRFSYLSSGIHGKDVKPIKNEKVLPFVIDMVANLYKGDANMKGSSKEEETKYKIAVGFFKHLDKLSVPLSKRLKALGVDSIYSVVKPLLLNEGICDANAVLKY